MKLSSFSRQNTFYPKTLGNAQAAQDDKFYVTINTLNNTDMFELNAVMLRAQALHKEADDMEKVEYDDPENPGQKLTRISTEAALLKQQAALAVIDGFGRIAVKYCELHNLNGADDTPVSIQDMVNYPILSETIIEIMTHIMGVSQVDEDDEKNS